MHTSLLDAQIGNRVTVINKEGTMAEGELRRTKDRGWYILHSTPRNDIPLWHEDYDANEEGVLVHVQFNTLAGFTAQASSDNTRPHMPANLDAVAAPAQVLRPAYRPATDEPLC